MLCIDQNTAEKTPEPFETLAKTRRVNGKVYFGQHICHLPTGDHASTGAKSTIAVGDPVRVAYKKIAVPPKS